MIWWAPTESGDVGLERKIIARGDQIGVPCVFMRGGTSRGAIIRRADLPADDAHLSAVVLSIYGSPDVRQINGIGGATGQTSKVCIVSESDRPGVDIEYTFGQVRIDEPFVDFVGNCGNMASAVAAYAVDEGYARVSAGATECDVNMYFTNTDQIVHARVPVVRDAAGTIGWQRVEGVPGTGAPIFMDMRETAGTLGQGVLPLGVGLTEITTPKGRFEVSVVDVGNAAVFVRAADVGMRGTELPSEMSDELIHRLLAIRAEVASQLGLCDSPEEAESHTPATPKMYAVGPPANYTSVGGRPVIAEEISLCSRGLVMGRPHQSHAATVAVCAAVAARIPGTVVNEAALPLDPAGRLNIGHPSGVMSVSAAVSGTGKELVVESASIILTARRLMDGYAYASMEIDAQHRTFPPPAELVDTTR